MKRVFLSMSFVIIIVFGSGICAFAVDINVNGTNVVFTDQTGKPYVDHQNRTQVPLRVTMESAGANVSWDAPTKTATIEKMGVTVKVPIGQNFILKDGKQIPNDTIAVIKDGRTYLPIRPVLEAFDFTVDWDASSKTVYAANFNDYVLNQDSVLQEKRKNIKSAEDLIDYYKSYLQYQEDKEVAVNLAEQKAFERIAQKKFIYEWYTDKLLAQSNISVDYSGLEFHSGSGESTLNGKVVLSEDGLTYTINIPNFKGISYDGSVQSFDGVRVMCMLMDGITGFTHSYKLEFNGEDLLNLGFHL